MCEGFLPCCLVSSLFLHITQKERIRFFHIFFSQQLGEEERRLVDFFLEGTERHEKMKIGSESFSYGVLVKEKKVGRLVLPVALMP